MFCPVGYVTIAELWNEFSQKHRATLIQFILEQNQKEALAIAEEHGSPDDYCEDIFLASFKSFSAYVANTNGRVSKLLIDVDLGHSNIFTKMSALESFFAASDPIDAGEDGYWLRRMGSNNFVALDPHDREAWKNGVWEQRCLNGDDFAFASHAYHTLPYVFERGRYIIPDTPPPWHGDAIDEHFLPKIVELFAGNSLCLLEKDANKWRKVTLNGSTFVQALMGEKISIGRTSKIPAAMADMKRVFPKGLPDISWKQMLSQIALETGNRYSESTLRRAIERSEL
ncbi:hypothetical protein GCM10008927_29300 [Amylibacter ulvae]|uniref:Uncharacterized protein n=1 Tax=Paramylibacter ulvae TaxID=1651968 RepID=A0ABQ3DCA6_9RHOB|nr:hypothetical protein [Amylibacter ulvae]GHA61962.1 hypothetical protein GCM10008927_29300 [Amylibacter ulvae]